MRHPSVPGAQIQNVKLAAGLPFRIRQDRAFEGAKAARPDSPLFRIFAAQVPIGQRAVIGGVSRATAFGVADLRVMIQELLPDGRIHSSTPAKYKKAMV